MSCVRGGEEEYGREGSTQRARGAVHTDLYALGPSGVSPSVIITT